MSLIKTAGPQMARQKPHSPGGGQDTNSRRLACDRCHSLKEKCTFDNDLHRLSCSRCSRLAKPCITSRQKHGGGRPRKLINTPTRPQAGVEFVWHGDGAVPPDAISALSGFPTGPTRASSPGTLSQSSDRVNGDKSPPVPDDTPAPQPRGPIQPLLQGLSDSTVLVNRTPLEVTTICNLLAARQDFMRPFVLGPSFLQSAQNTFRYGVYAAPDVLLSVHLAVLARSRIMFHRGRGRPNSDVEGSDYAYCARAVRTLRQRGTAADMHTHDWLLTLMLGLYIITFDLLDSGVHAHSITRFTLGLLMQHLARTGRRAGSAAATAALQRLEYGMVPLVFFDMWNSIVRREVPVCRFAPQTPAVVDRYLGLCGSLLPHLYDICCLSRDLSETPGGAAAAGFHERYQELRNVVLLWEPSIPETAVDSYTPQEIRLINAQVKIYRYTALLVLHRIRYAFGERDETAGGLALTVLTDIESLFSHRLASSPIIGPRLTEPETRPPRGGWFEYRLVPAFLVASVELVDPEQRDNVMRRLSPVVCKQMYPNVGFLIREFLPYIWDARDGGYSGHWFDLARDGPPLVLF